ncbi:MAG: glycosyltransferase [Gemmataceae bacterium]|nr:glycosyltransferase [Gemmataceae bacterium]MDW8265816.1 glycosyltransferase [Gemmataceae bacterium]
MRVSLTMIVKNEAHQLPTCLACVAGLVDEIIVVDTGSTDETRQQAEAAGARVIDFPWPDSFAVARNEALRHATGEWIFWLDADDRVDEDNRWRLQRLFRQLRDENVAWMMQCVCPVSPETGATGLLAHARLFRNHPAIRWEYRVHEQIVPAVQRAGGEVRWSDVTIFHAGYVDHDDYRRRLQRNLRLLELDVAERPNDPWTLYNLGLTLDQMGQWADAAQWYHRSLRVLPPGNPLEPRLYALLIEKYRWLGRRGEALAFCRAAPPGAAGHREFLHQQACLLQDVGDLTGAEAALRTLLRGGGGHDRPTHETAGLDGYLARGMLARLCQQQGRWAEAEQLWRQTLAEQPNYLDAWVGLADTLLAQGRLADLDRLVGQAPSEPHLQLTAAVLRARCHQARGELGLARRQLEEIVKQRPQWLLVRVMLAEVLIQEGIDFPAAEWHLREVTRLDPTHAVARRLLSMIAPLQSTSTGGIYVCW